MTTRYALRKCDILRNGQFDGLYAVLLRIYNVLKQWFVNEVLSWEARPSAVLVGCRSGDLSPHCSVAISLLPRSPLIVCGVTITSSRSYINVQRRCPRTPATPTKESHLALRSINLLLTESSNRRFFLFPQHTCQRTCRSRVVVNHVRGVLRLALMY